MQPNNLSGGGNAQGNASSLPRGLHPAPDASLLHDSNMSRSLQHGMSAPNLTNHQAIHQQQQQQQQQLQMLNNQMGNATFQLLHRSQSMAQPMQQQQQLFFQQQQQLQQQQRLSQQSLMSNPQQPQVPQMNAQWTSVVNPTMPSPPQKNNLMMNLIQRRNKQQQQQPPPSGGLANNVMAAPQQPHSHAALLHHAMSTPSLLGHAVGARREQQQPLQQHPLAQPLGHNNKNMSTPSTINVTFSLPASSSNSSRPSAVIQALKESKMRRQASLPAHMHSNFAKQAFAPAAGQANAQFAIVDPVQPQQQQQPQQHHRQLSLLTKVPSLQQFPVPSSRTRKLDDVLTKAEQNPKYKAASMDQLSLLHNSCKLYPDTVMVVESALRMDPDAIRRPVPMVCNPGSNNAAEGGIDQTAASRKRRALERFSYPINIALKYNASLEVVELLAKEGPDVLEKPDGPDACGSLTTALGLGRGNDVVELLIGINPACAKTLDRHFNTPLHTIIRAQTATMDVVKAVYNAYPPAVTMVNFHKETPLDVAARSESCPEAIVNFLQSKAFTTLEATASHLDEAYRFDEFDDTGI